MRNFFSDPGRIRGDCIELDPGEAHHVRNVLRLPPGEIIRVLDGKGTLYEGAWDPGGARVRIGRTIRVSPFRCDVTLAVALLKADHWDWLLQKAVEIGISHIVPLLACNSVVKIAPPEIEKRVDRWNQIAISAIKQSGQAFLPSIATPTTVEHCCNAETPRRGVSTTETTEARWICNERGGAALRSLLTPDLRRVTLMVGPEGGWSDAELETAQKQGFQAVSLGSQILRAETVPLYLLSVIRFVTE